MDLARHLVVAAAVLCLVSPGEASDRFLWDQSDVVVPSSVGPLEIVAVADDFIVPGVQEWLLIEAADVWMQDDMELPIDGILTGFDGTVGWAIYRQAFGEPSTLVASGVDTGALTMGPTIPACCWDTQLVRFRFDPPVRLGSGIYWLGIREGAWGQPADFTPVHASASARILGSSTRSAPVGAVPVAWNLGGGSDLAFAIYGSASPWSQEAFDAVPGAAPVTSAVAATDFILAQSFTPSRAEIVVGDGDATPDGVVDNLEGALGWGLYSDSSGAPGTLLQSGTTEAPLQMTVIGASATVGDYAAVRLDLSTVGSLAAGSYWLAVREGPWGTGAADGTETSWLVSEVFGNNRCTSAALAVPGGWACGVHLDLAISLAADLVYASGFEAGVTWAWTGTIGASASP